MLSSSLAWSHLAGFAGWARGPGATQVHSPGAARRRQPAPGARLGTGAPPAALRGGPGTQSVGPLGRGRSCSAPSGSVTAAWGGARVPPRPIPKHRVGGRPCFGGLRIPEGTRGLSPGHRGPGPSRRAERTRRPVRRAPRRSLPVSAPAAGLHPNSFPPAPPRARPRALSGGGAGSASRTRERGGRGARRALRAAPTPAPRPAGHAPGSRRGAHRGRAMRSGAERRGSGASAPPGSPPPGRARPDAPLAPQPPAAGQPRARDAGDARAQPRPLFAWSKWKKRMGSSMSAATARRPVFDDKEDGERGSMAGTRPLPGTAWGSRALSPGGCGGGTSPRSHTGAAGWEGVLERLGARGNSQTVQTVPTRAQGAARVLHVQGRRVPGHSRA